LDRNGFKRSESECDTNKMNQFLSISIHFRLLGRHLFYKNTYWILYTDRLSLPRLIVVITHPSLSRIFTLSICLCLVLNPQAKIDVIQGRYPILKKFRDFSIPLVEDGISIYTDGSKTEDSPVGAAIYSPELSLALKHKLPSDTSIFSAETWAIYQAFILVESSQFKKPFLVIAEASWTLSPSLIKKATPTILSQPVEVSSILFPA